MAGLVAIMVLGLVLVALPRLLLAQGRGAAVVVARLRDAGVELQTFANDGGELGGVGALHTLLYRVEDEQIVADVIADAAGV